MGYREVLSIDPASFGTPEDPKPLGFMVLAKAGREIWNSWRADFPTELDPSNGKWTRAVRWHQENPSQHVSLAEHRVDFSGFEFGDGADFFGQQFPSSGGHVKFENSRFGDGARFDSARFGAGVTFKGAHFGRNASFAYVALNSDDQTKNTTDWISFENAQFGDGARIFYVTCQWGHGIDKMPEVSFKGVRFGDGVRFALHSNSTPFRSLNFTGATFGKVADFSSSFLKGMVVFRRCRFGNDTTFAYASFDDVDFAQCQFGDWVDFKGDDFRWISFTGSVFEGRAHFSNRKFKAHTNFSGVRFDKVPLFHDCELHQDTEFEEDSFPAVPEGTTTAARGYRTLKLAMSTHQATREEQFFFRQEMKEERVVLWRSARRNLRMRASLYFLYDLLSEYGGSVRRPAIGFVAAWILFAGLYALSSSATPWLPGRAFDGARTADWLMYSFVNSLPLSGLDETSRELRAVLFHASPARWLPGLLVIHKVISLLFLFLVGLALRNLFKLK